MTTPAAIGRLRIERQLGAGGFATVWLARDPDLDSPVAVKILAENFAAHADIRRRFIDEARLLRRVDSDHLVRVYDVGELPDGRPFFVMTYADRGNLAERMGYVPPPWPPHSVIAIVEAVAEGLTVLHGHGVVHRDLKPVNVLLRSTPDGSERVLLGDLGIAKDLQWASGLTMPAGSSGYAAPEQSFYSERIGPSTDVHALAVTAGQLLALQPPWPASPLGAVLARATDPEPERRTPTAAAFAAQLRESLLPYLASTPAPPTVPPMPTPMPSGPPSPAVSRAPSPPAVAQPPAQPPAALPAQPPAQPAAARAPQAAPPQAAPPQAAPPQAAPPQAAPPPPAPPPPVAPPALPTTAPRPTAPLPTALRPTAPAAAPPFSGPAFPTGPIPGAPLLPTSPPGAPVGPPVGPGQTPLRFGPRWLLPTAIGAAAILVGAAGFVGWTVFTGPQRISAENGRVSVEVPRDLTRRQPAAFPGRNDPSAGFRASADQRSVAVALEPTVLDASDVITSVSTAGCHATGPENVRVGQWEGRAEHFACDDGTRLDQVVLNGGGSKAFTVWVEVRAVAGDPSLEATLASLEISTN